MRFLISIAPVFFSETKALIGEAENFNEAKSFCESKNAHIPNEKLEFPNNKSHDYWIEVDDQKRIQDQQLLDAMAHFEEVSSHKDVTVSLMTNKNCIFLIDKIQSIWKGNFSKKLDHQVNFLLTNLIS